MGPHFNTSDVTSTTAMGRSSIAKHIKRFYIVFVLWLFVLLSVNKFIICNSGDENPSEVTVKQVLRHISGGKVKKILVWNAIYDKFGFNDELAFEKRHCKVSDCILSNDKALMPPDTADAIVFFYTSLCELPKIYGRSSHQRYVLITDDTPNRDRRNHYKREPYFGSFFNWTISYRKDSDIIWNRGWVEKVHKTLKLAAMTRYYSSLKSPLFSSLILIDEYC